MASARQRPSCARCRAPLALSGAPSSAEINQQPRIFFAKTLSRSWAGTPCRHYIESMKCPSTTPAVALLYFPDMLVLQSHSRARLPVFIAHQATRIEGPLPEQLLSSDIVNVQHSSALSQLAAHRVRWRVERVPSFII